MFQISLMCAELKLKVKKTPRKYQKLNTNLKNQHICATLGRNVKQSTKKSSLRNWEVKSFLKTLISFFGCCTLPKIKVVLDYI